MKHDDAVRELYQVAHDRFVAERKRLADLVRAAGDRAGAARIVKIPRPSISAWAVNQLYWHARDAVDEMLSTAARLRAGDLAATNAHRDAIARLRQRAANMLADAGHAATEATLRRVTTNLSAIAAIGSFDPDPPGGLAADRAAPGFEAVGAVVATPSTASEPEPRGASPEEEQRRRDEEKRRAEDHARLRAERERVAAALRTATGDLDAGERRVRTLEHDLRDAEAAVTKLRAIAEDLEHKLAGFDEEA